MEHNKREPLVTHAYIRVDSDRVAFKMAADIAPKPYSVLRGVDRHRRVVRHQMPIVMSGPKPFVC